MKKDDFNLPKNIRQMGGIDENLKVYIEDYVFTYLQQHSKEAKGEERIAILVGETLVLDGCDVLFINGAIKINHIKQEDGMIKLTDDAFDEVEYNIKKYFEKSSVIGWFYSQPGFLDYINDGYVNYHTELFKEDNKVFLLADPIDNISVFHRYSNDKNDLEALRGFIIYYEKNQQMNDYMIANKSIDIKVEEEKIKQKDKRLINISRDIKQKNMTKLAIEHKKLSNIFACLSSVLFIVCFIMGSGLIQSDDRISELEKKLSQLDESYRYVLSQIKDDNVQSVFAENMPSTSSMVDITEIETVLTTSSIEKITTQTTKSTTQATTKSMEITSSLVSLPKKVEFSSVSTYQIESGDSLELISNKFYGSTSNVAKIMEVNGIENPNKIFAGMTIKLP